MGTVTIVDTRNTISPRLKEWLIARGYCHGFITVDSDRPSDDPYPVPYLSVFEKDATHREGGFFLRRLRKRRRCVGTLLFGVDHRTSRPTTDKKWVFKCSGTAGQIQAAELLARELAQSFKVEITIEHVSDQPVYEKFISETYP